MSIRTFKPGEVARSEDVNANFNHVLSLLGTLSTTGRISPPGELAMGPRQNVLLTNRHDTSNTSNRFFQIGWNVNWTNVAGKGYQRSRFLANQPATAIKIGANTFEILSTSKTTGNLHSQMPIRLRFWTNDTTSFLFLEEGTRITDRNAVPANAERERLTTVLFNTPKAIYNKIRVAKGNTVFNAYNYGVPRHAKAIFVRAHVTASWASGAGLIIYQTGGPMKEKGMVAHATWSSHGGNRLGMRTGASGIVPLGLGANAGRFTVERTEVFEEAIVHIIGYLT